MPSKVCLAFNTISGVFTLGEAFRGAGDSQKVRQLLGCPQVGAWLGLLFAHICLKDNARGAIKPERALVLGEERRL